MQAAGVDEVGVLAAQGFWALAFMASTKAAMEPASHSARMLQASLAETMSIHCRSCFHRHDLPGLDPGGAAVRVVIGVAEGAFRGGDLLVQQCFIAADLFQDQQSRHDLGQAGGIVLLMDVFGIGHGVGVHVHQQRGLGLDVR